MPLYVKRYTYSSAQLMSLVLTKTPVPLWKVFQRCWSRISLPLQTCNDWWRGRSL